MFRKRGRPPEQLPIGGYEYANEREDKQTPIHQSLVPLETPRQLPLPSVREFDQDVVMRQEKNAENELSAQPLLSQQNDLSISQDRRFANNPLHNTYSLGHCRTERRVFMCAVWAAARATLSPVTCAESLANADTFRSSRLRVRASWAQRSPTSFLTIQPLSQGGSEIMSGTPHNAPLALQLVHLLVVRTYGAHTSNAASGKSGKHVVWKLDWRGVADSGGRKLDKPRLKRPMGLPECP